MLSNAVIGVGILGAVSAVINIIITGKMMKGGWSMASGYQPRKTGLPMTHTKTSMPPVKPPKGGTGRSRMIGYAAHDIQPERPIPSGIRVMKENGRIVKNE